MVFVVHLPPHVVTYVFLICCIMTHALLGSHFCTNKFSCSTSALAVSGALHVSSWHCVDFSSVLWPEATKSLNRELCAL